MNEDLKNIKDKYGEKMMHLCRTFFSTLLEQEGLLFNTLSQNFHYSKFLYDDIIENSLEYSFKDYIYSLIDVENNNVKIQKTPFELLNDAGYDLYECKSEKDIQSFKKYYAPGEALCTFNGNRLDYCHVFFAVNKNVNNIKRKDFIKPQRQDEYGTSVISIQFSKGKNNTLSIKNRYNHRVNNPDATFSNNLDNIIPGLTQSFEQYYGLNINCGKRKSFEIPGYVRANDGKFYKYNYEINNIYYCTDNIIIDNYKVITYYQDKEKYLVMDYFIINLETKDIYFYKSDYIEEYEFLIDFKNIKKIEINKIKETKEKEIKFIFDNYEIYIKIDKFNRMISYKNEYIKDIGNGFLTRNKYLENIEIPNVIEIMDYFLYSNQNIKKLKLPKVIRIGHSFLKDNKQINYFRADKLNTAGNYFMYNAEELCYFSADNLCYVGYFFLRTNKYLKKLSLPNLELVQDSFLSDNQIIEDIYIPRLVYVGKNFMVNNNSLIKFDAPSLKKAGDYFLYFNNSLKEFSAPKLKKIGDYFLVRNNTLEKLTLPEIQKKCKYFGMNNNNFKKILNKTYKK